MWTMRLLLVGGVIACAAPCYAQGPAPAAADIIAAAKAASGGAAWDRLTTTHDSGKVTAGGLQGTYDNWLDWVHLKSANAYVVGPARGSAGFDGRTAWSTDTSGQVRVETSAAAVASAIQQVYLETYALYFPGRYPAVIAASGPRSDGGKTYQAIKVTPQGADAVEIWFDAASHLPSRVVQLSGSQPSTTLFSDYRAVDGVTLPFHTVIRVGNNPKYDQIADMTAFESVAVPEARFAPPPPPAYDASFPGGQTEVTVPIRLINNHIYLNVSIDGQPPAPFIFDTGAVNFMDASHAKALGVKAEGALPGGGFGNGISAIGLAKVASVSVGGLTLHDQLFATNDLSSLEKVEGYDAAGLIGYEFAKRTVVTIDYAHHRMIFTKPDAFRPPQGVTPVRFTFAAHVPMVQASIDGLAGQFEIDTGSRGPVTLMHPFAQAHGLVEKYRAKTLATTGYGLGGPSRALLARGGTLTIGDVALHDPLIDLVNDTAGAAAETRIAGNIGGDVLKRFTLTLDYGHQLLCLQPNAMAATPMVFDRSGLWLNRADDGSIAIGDVTPNSAASAAGLTAGEHILSVNGKQAALWQLYTLREALKGRPGTVMRLVVAGADGKHRKVALRLADQV